MCTSRQFRSAANPSIVVCDESNLVSKEARSTCIFQEPGMRTAWQVVATGVALGLRTMTAFAGADLPTDFVGVWSMSAAYEIKADGTRTTNYGEHPRGLLMIDKSGQYSLQIFRPDRPKFAAGDKTRGSPEEYREAVLGSSTHTGRLSVDADKGQLRFAIDAASYPNWEGALQVRDYSFKDGLLTYSV